MTNAPHGMVLFGALMAWGIYRRVRSNIGQQKLRPTRLIVRLVILSLVSVLLVGSSFLLPGVSQNEALLLTLSFFGGALLGAALAMLGLRHTKFETTADGHYYTPNTYIGLGLSALVLGRVGYRFFQLQNQSYQSGHPEVMRSPLTMFVIGLSIGYYLAYCTGLFVHTHDKKPADIAEPPVLIP